MDLAAGGDISGFSGQTIRCGVVIICWDIVSSAATPERFAGTGNTGKSGTEREPGLWCEKYHYETSASELHGCFEPELSEEKRVFL